jgi:hypothetical protein
MKRTLEIFLVFILVLSSLDFFIAKIFINYLINIPFFRDGIFNIQFWNFLGQRFDQYLLVFGTIIRSLLSLSLLITIIYNKGYKIQTILICILLFLFELPFVYFTICSEFPFISLLILYEFLFSVLFTILFLYYFNNLRKYTRNVFFKLFIILGISLVSLVILFFGVRVLAKNRVDNKEVYDLMKSQIDTTDIIDTQILIKDCHYNALTKKRLIEYSNYFSKFDIIYMIAQLDNNQNFQWNSQVFPKPIVLLTNKQIHSISINDNSDEFWKAFHKKYKSNFSSYTKPLFSYTGDYALIEYSFYCGSTCGWGIVLVLKKIDDKWIVIKKDNVWMS